MRKKQSSLPAAGIAIARAVESERPADERICYDPYARRFVPAWMYRAFGFFIKIGYAEWRGPGVNSFLVAQDRSIKERGFQQVKVVKANNLRETYLTGKNAGRAMAGGYGIVIGKT